ncbi:MAG: DUF393 domain-containing protein [Bdellovibrionaceae bacterium]|nr:DUF393 domain-containing protein [Bdellovibrio sp.]
MKNQIKLKVYYDGLCKVCSKEINHYKRQVGADQIEFIDICSSQFQAAQEGLNPHKIHKIMHVRRSDGTILTRVDAFIEIWKVLPKYNFLAKIANKRFFKMGLEVFYSAFVAVRPLLPRYANASQCQDSPYCELKNG